MEKINGDNSKVIERYQDEVTLNTEALTTVSQEVVLDSLTFIAVNNQAFINISKKNFA